MSTETEIKTDIIGSDKQVQRGRSKKTLEEYLTADEKNRENALKRYYEKKELYKEKSKLNQQRYRQLYKYVKELVKEDKLEHLTNEQKHHLKQLLCLE